MDIPNNSFIVIGKSCFYIFLAKKKYPIGGELTLHLFSSQKKNSYLGRVETWMDYWWSQ